MKRTIADLRSSHRPGDIARTVFRLVAAGLPLLLSACGSLPDVKPFAAATLSLEKSVAASFEATAAAHDHMAAILDVPDGHPLKATELKPRAEQYAALAKAIRDEAEPRATLMRALTDYTDGLASVVEASENAQGNVDALADSVVGLAAVFQASPLPAVAAGAVDLGKLALREGIRMKASRDLREGIATADPVVQQAGELLLADVESLRAAVEPKVRAAPAAVRLAGGEIYLAQRRHVQRLEDRRLSLLKVLNGQPADVDIEGLGASEDLQKVISQLTSAREAVREYDAIEQAAVRDMARTLELLSAMEEGIAAWAKAHAELKVAAEQGGQVNVRRLVEVAMEAKGIIEKMNAAKENDHAGN